MLDARKNRLMIFLHVVLAVAYIMREDYVNAFAAISATYATQFCQDGQASKVLYSLAGLAEASHLRVPGTLGYLFAAMGKSDVSNPLLALHYSLVGVDDASISPLGRCAALGIALMFAA